MRKRRAPAGVAGARAGRIPVRIAKAKEEARGQAGAVGRMPATIIG